MNDTKGIIIADTLKSEAFVGVNPVIQRDANGNVYPSKCSVEVEVVPDPKEPNGFRLKTLSWFSPQPAP